MKRIFSLTLALVALVSLVTLNLHANGDGVVSSSQLPKAAHQFLSKHFPGRAITQVKRDHYYTMKTYAVRLADGTDIEFTLAGAWREVEGNQKPLPLTFIPTQIVKAVQSKYAGDPIVHIEYKGRGYQVELASGLDLLFSHRFQILEDPED